MATILFSDGSRNGDRGRVRGIDQFTLLLEKRSVATSEEPTKGTSMTYPPPPNDPQQPSYPPGAYTQQQPPPKKRRKWPWFLLAFVVIIVIIAVSTTLGGDNRNGQVTSTGEGDASAVEQESGATPIGSTVEIEEGGARFSATVQDLVPATPSEFGLPAQGELYQVTVVLEGIEGTANVNPLYLTARAADGTSYSAALGAIDGQLAATELPSGDVIRGAVAFDVTGPPIASIRYEGALGQQRASWTVE